MEKDMKELVWCRHAAETYGLSHDKDELNMKIIDEQLTCKIDIDVLETEISMQGLWLRG